MIPHIAQASLGLNEQQFEHMAQIVGSAVGIHAASGIPILLPVSCAFLMTSVTYFGATPRMEAFRTTGATHLAVPCAICKAQFPVAFKHYGVDAQVVGVMDLLGKAIVL